MSLTVTTIALCLLFGLVGQASAAGTVSGTTITSVATVDYQLGSIPQATVSTSTVTFDVDTKVDLSITTDDAAAVNVLSPSTNNFLSFTLTNTGNATQDFALSTASVLTSGAGAFAGNIDSFDSSLIEFFVESGASPGFQRLGDIAANYVDELAPDSSIKVYLIGQIPTALVDASIASYHLIATARVGGAVGSQGAALVQTTGADTAGVDVVFADGAGSSDGAGDARFSSQNDFKVVSATVTTTVSSTVIWDPVNLFVSPVSMPGAIIEYLVTVTNAGGSTISNVVISDSLNTQITSGLIAFNTQYDATPGNGLLVSHPAYLAGATTEYSNVNDGVEFAGVGADWNVTAVNTVTITGVSLSAGQSATLNFRVTIQ